MTTSDPSSLPSTSAATVTVVESRIVESAVMRAVYCRKMSGISGAWHLDGRPIDSRVLGTMAARMRHRGPDGERSRIDGSIGFSCQHLWVAAEDHGTYQPIVGASGAMLVMDGRLDNRDELVSALALDRRVSDARCVMSAYEKWTEGFAERLDGDFAVAIF